jgi:uncharacterized protein (DUF4415 family)
MAENKPAIYSDLVKVDATTDDEIARQIAEDADTAPELTDDWFDKADLHYGETLLRRGRGRPRLEAPKRLVSLRLDQEVIERFRAQGPGWQSRINAALREQLGASEDCDRRETGYRYASTENVSEEPENYLRYYDLEKYLFDEVRTKFCSEGTLDPVDFYMILIWKSNRAKNKAKDRLAHLSGSFAEAVGKIGCSIYNVDEPKEKLETIMAAPWRFRLPTATAILTVLYPGEFTIYDVRICEELPQFKGLGDQPFSDRMWERYREFKVAVEARAPVELSLRDKDRYLWGKSFYKSAVQAVYDGTTKQATSKLIRAAVSPTQLGGKPNSEAAASETRAVIGQTSLYADGKPALEIHAPKAQAKNLPINKDGRVNINLKIGNRRWSAKLHMTKNCPYVWISPTLINSAGRRCRLVDALVDFRPKDRVILKTEGREVEVIREEVATQ